MSGHLVRRAGAAGLALGILLGTPSATATAGAGAGAPPDSAALTRFLQRQVRMARIPGAAVVVVRSDGECYAAAFAAGAGAGAGATAPTPDSPMGIGSVTKTFTALAIAQLVDDGRLRFDDPVTAHLPGFTLRNGFARPITLRHLLTHTSGLRQWDGHDRRAQREARFDHIAPARPPGDRFEYSSLNYILLGRVIEAVSGASYADHVRARILEPLGMRASFAGLDAARGAGLAGGHRYLFAWPVPAAEPDPPPALVPAGFLVASARDLGRYLSMLLADGRSGPRRIVSPSSLREIMTPWHGEATGPGMAWGVGPTRIGHAGNTRTFSARLALLPAEGYGIAVLTDVNSGPLFAGSADLMDGIVRILRQEEADPAWPREIAFKLAILLLLVLELVRLARNLARWTARGFPRRLDASPRAWRPLALECGFALLALVAIPRWIGVPLPALLEYFPDLGLALIAGAGLGLSRAVLEALLRSAGPGPRAARRLHAGEGLDGRSAGMDAGAWPRG
jgi:CubicO group peptidase (beta-lactamase class C family)